MTTAALQAAPPPTPMYTPTLHPDAMPEVYAMICDGDCMEPYYHHGQKLLFSKTESWQAGDPVVVFRRPEFLRPGENQMLFKQLLSSPPASYWQNKSPYGIGNVKPVVILRMLNPLRTLCFEADSLLGIHKFIGV